MCADAPDPSPLNGSSKLRQVTGPNSAGLSIRNWRFGAVKTSGSAVGDSCVATDQFGPAAGRTNVTRTGRSSRPGIHIRLAGMLRCACVVSIDTYVPSTRSP